MGGVDNPQCGCFLAEMCAKMKELGPVGGGVDLPLITRKTFIMIFRSCLLSNMYCSGRSRISHRGGVHPLGGCGPLMRVLFSENVCKNEKVGSNRGRRVPGTLSAPRSANVLCGVEEIKHSLNG